MGFYERALDALKHEATSIPGVRNVLRKLINAEVPYCVASNGLMAKMHVTLERTQMLAWFEGNMFSAYEANLSKPGSNVFLSAAKANGIQARDCFVVEDSASGFEAAANAKMACLAYLPGGEEPEVGLFGAHPFHDMDAVPAMLFLAS